MIYIENVNSSKNDLDKSMEERFIKDWLVSKSQEYLESEIFTIINSGRRWDKT